MSKRIRVLVLAGAALIVAVAVADSYAHRFDGFFTCLSDDLSTIQDGLENYEKNHAGEIPASFEEFRAFWSSANQNFPLETYWRKHHGGLVWNPSLKTAGGWPVLVMCPAGSHGLLRRFAWGLAKEAGAIRFVRVESDRVIPYK